MPVAPAYHESLPYIDAEPDQAALQAARSLITAEAGAQQPPSEPSATITSSSPQHHKDPEFTPLIQTELERIASKTALPAFDVSRYEAQETPSASLPREELRAILAKSYTSHTYLTSRAQNLELLDKYGKNAWLVGNYALEEELKSLERELAETKKEIDVVNLERKRKQEEVKGEMEGLEQGWKRGVGRVLETEVAVEDLKRQLREELKKHGP